MTVQHGARSFITTFEDEFSVRFINGITDIHRVFISSGWQREPSWCLRISAVTQWAALREIKKSLVSRYSLFHEILSSFPLSLFLKFKSSSFLRSLVPNREYLYNDVAVYKQALSAEIYTDNVYQATLTIHFSANRAAYERIVRNSLLYNSFILYNSLLYHRLRDHPLYTHRKTRVSLFLRHSRTALFVIIVAVRRIVANNSS